MNATQRAAPDAAELYDVAAKQLCYKPGPIRDAMRQIVQQLLAAPTPLWGDEFTLTASAADRNCVGTAFRLLIHAGIVTRLPEFRRSQAEQMKSRVVWRYRLESTTRARTFLARNGATEPEQPELSLA